MLGSWRQVPDAVCSVGVLRGCRRRRDGVRPELRVPSFELWRGRRGCDRSSPAIRRCGTRGRFFAWVFIIPWSRSAALVVDGHSPIAQENIDLRPTSVAV